MTPTLILTRPAAQSESFAADIAARWEGPLHIIQSPLIEIVPVQASCDAPDAVIFTSANGVGAAKQLGLSDGLTAWCVGAKTADAALAAGFAPIIGPGNADGLLSDIIAAKPAGTLAHIRGKHARGDVRARLIQAGVNCKDVVVYDQQEQPLSDQANAALSAITPLIFPLFSPRMAAILSKQGPFAAPIHAVALSQAVAEALATELVDSLSVAPVPDAAAMLDATLAAMRAQFGRS
ncbi:uroporphyrinogen-III synthase [Yoonia sp. F2084L]|uniref:uroporphyrinogen-III synthase n=1 Tax=Yoonia sp. F2084L TaxID=2926419 RepID=UPI001FF3FC4F|nr:uroporphyrinogen-III synthase [Yoonia sp. F2084L]MCK0097503.1 uroporphyrinogen-III synthase [Yoonia sp. F2084L]